MIGKNLFNILFDEGSLSEKEHLVINEDPEATQLADLVSIRSDLKGASAACVLFAEEAARENVDTVCLRIFFESAIISYARPFASGKGVAEKKPRRRIDNLLESLDKEQTEVHAKALQRRNQHVGHRVDPLEQSAMVIASFDRYSLKFKSVSPFLMDRIDGPLMSELAHLTEVLLVLIDDQISKEIDELTEMYTIQDEMGQLQLPEVLVGIDRD